MKRVPWSVTAAHALIIVNGAFWLVFAFAAALGKLPGSLSTGLVRWVMALLALGIALVLGILVLNLIRRKKWAYYFTLVLLIFLAILSITDEVGAFDLFSLIICLVGSLLLVVNRTWYIDSSKLDQRD